MKRCLMAAPLLAALAVIGCGGASHHTSHPTVAAPAKASRCPAGKSFMGCAGKATALPRLAPAVLAPPSGALFPDVSMFQPNVNWGAVAAWQRSRGQHPEAIWKMGEFHIDPQARRNASETRRLGFARAGYWFVRNTGCSSEGSQILTEARAEGVRNVVLDAEVPEARGYTACLAPRIRAAGLRVFEYTSPGSNPDGGNPGVDMWVAAYGPAAPPCVFTCNVAVSGKQSIRAWQFTDGRFGAVVNVPGIGRDDVSIDYGLNLAGTPTPTPKPQAKWASVEVQHQGLNATATVTVKNGRWSVSKGWRLRALPFNAPPLGAK